MQTTTPKILLTEREAADLIGLSIRWMQESRVSGDGPPYVRISSRCIRYRLIDIETWADERVRTSTSDVG